MVERKRVVDSPARSALGRDERKMEKQPIQVNHTTEYRERGRGNMLLPRFFGGEDMAKARPAEGELGSMTRSVAEEAG